MITSLNITDAYYHLNLSGQCDQTNARALRQQLLDYIETTPTPRLLIDLSNLHVIHPSGLATFLTISQQAYQQGGLVIFVSPTPNISALIEAINLQHELLIYYDSEAAAYSLQEQLTKLRG